MTQPDRTPDEIYASFETIAVAIEENIAWVTLNRPDKRNAMSPRMNREMVELLDVLEIDERCGVVVLTGAGEAFSSGMDLKEFFKEMDGVLHVKRMRALRDASIWQWQRLLTYYKPTIAMVNGWCFGGAVTPMVACDLAIAADDAVFGISEINWGILPGGNVAKALSATMNSRDALYYIMTGESFDGKKAAAMGLVNESVPAAELKTRVTALAKTLLGKNPTALRQAKIAFRAIEDMPWDVSFDYLSAKSEQTRAIDPEKGRDKGMSQFLDAKTYRPGLGGYDRDK
jgi:trans-feruloyl-CoA hydratase/vanillin synthase